MEEQKNSIEQQKVVSDKVEFSEVKDSRRTFLRGPLMGAALAVPMGLLMVGTASADDKKNDKKDNDDKKDHDGKKDHDKDHHHKKEYDYKKLARIFREIQQHENDHVAFLINAIKQAGATPRPKPTFKGLLQHELERFLRLSRTFENVGVGAYLGAAPEIDSKAYLSAAGSILAVEARHAGVLGVILNGPLSPNGSFDKALTQKEVVFNVANFIESLNGGSDPLAPFANDVDILNFALLLEYLEAEFYNLNVAKFFS